MTFALTVVLGIVILGIMVLIHELGHFCAAKWLGFRVLAFSIGFGKPLISKTVNGTDYRISAIPFGGYVKMSGDNPDENYVPDPGDFIMRPKWQRATVAIAGPLANYLSAILMLWIMFMVGVERPAYYDRPIVGAVADSSAAKAAGIAIGDSIIAVNGQPVKTWEELENRFLAQEKRYTVSFVRNGVPGEKVLESSQKTSKSAMQPLQGMLPLLPAIVGSVVSASPADRAGIRSGDTVMAIDGIKTWSWFQLTEQIQSGKADQPLQIDLARSGARLSVSVMPKFEAAEKRRIVGIRVAEQKGRTVAYAARPALHQCFKKTWEYTTMIFDVLGKLVSQKVSASQLAGPVGIIPASGYVALQGLSPILNFMGLISINLAVLNLFPLIITDGGMLLFLLIEAIRRRPLTIKTQMVITKIGIAFFITFFLYVTFNDINRLPEMFRIFGK